MGQYGRTPLAAAGLLVYCYGCTWFWRFRWNSAWLRVTIRPSFLGHVLFLGLCLGVRAGFQKMAVCPVFA